MSGYSDGFSRGTNYNRRMAAHDSRADLAAALTQDAKCAAGEHDEVTAEHGRVTYLAGRRLAAGTRYCRRCFCVLAKGEGPVS